MSDNPPADRPGHLDIDAVSAFIDRDLILDDLAALERHLTQCSACQREVLEIQATVLLLASLPQYAPRRSFCLGREHAALRASRRHAATQGSSWASPLFGPIRDEGSVGAGRFTGMLTGLQAAAVAIGALLVLVMVMDLGALPTQAPLQLVAPTAMATTVAPPPEAINEEPVLALQREGEQPGGTAGDLETSDEVQAPAESAPAPRAATGAAAAVTEVVTPPTGLARQPDAAEPEQPPIAQPALGGESFPSLGVAKIALAVMFFWLVVSIVGLRRMRG